MEREDATEIAASSRNEGQAKKTDEQKGKMLPAQGTTTVLSLIGDKWLIHTFFPLISFKQPHP